MIRANAMRLQIHSQRVQIDEPLRIHIERRLRRALSRFSRRLRHVQLNLRDVNGPRGGLDKQCRIVVDIAPVGRTVAVSKSNDPIDAVNQAAVRSARIIAQRLKRRVSLRQRPSRP
jgi:putative sigma-54 modulation protein